MASNPMQRKARNSFLLGMVVTLLITGAIIAFLIFNLTKIKQEEKEAKLAMKTVYVIKENVKSGQVITSDMITTQTVNSTLIPSNAINNDEIFENYKLVDKDGDELFTKVENNVATLYISKGDRDYEVAKDEGTGKYYITVSGQRQTLDIIEVPLIAKVNMNKNTLLTTELLARGNESQDDMRRQEYNILGLPIDLATGDYVDVRFALATGEEYIVVSKKEVEIPEIDGVASVDTVWMNLTEDEILSMNSAIVEAFRVPGSKLYVTKYVEPGLQEAATPTYPVRTQVLALINGNPNIVTEARNNLWARYNATDTQGNATQQNQRKNVLDPAVNEQGDQGKTNVQTKVEESITNSKTTRKTYLDSLGVPVEEE